MKRAWQGAPLDPFGTGVFKIHLPVFLACNIQEKKMVLRNLTNVWKIDVFQWRNSSWHVFLLENGNQAISTDIGS